MSWPCKPGERPVRRHDLVFVSPEGWRMMLGNRGDISADPLVESWSHRRWPTIRRRAVPCEPSGVPLGLPLPSSAGKKRLSFVAQPDDISSVARPPLLSEACLCAPHWWRPVLDRIDELALRHSVEVRVFGSLAWQALTSLDYLTARSDLDLVLDIGPNTDLDRLAAGLAALEREAPMRLDGELMRQDGAAVNWREFYSGAREVLVKSIGNVGLFDRHQFISGATRS